MKIFLILLLLQFSLYAKIITPSDVYAQTVVIEKEVLALLKYRKIKYSYKDFLKQTDIKTNIKPRNVWQKTYEIMIKINILRLHYNLPVIEPINLAPVLTFNPELVYEQTQRILTELNIIKLIADVKIKTAKVKHYKNKSPQHVYRLLSIVSNALDKLNGSTFTASYVFGENIRINDDLSTILHHLNIKDNTIPSIKNKDATPMHTFTTSMKTLYKISQIQQEVGIQSVDFAVFSKHNPTPSDVFTMTEMIISELQTIKAFIGLTTYITPAATQYSGKTQAEVDQLMQWNLRKINLITTLMREISVDGGGR
jgi:hypothetical protein